MLRSRIISALVISAVLVGGAGWFRLSSEGVVTYKLESVGGGPEEFTDEEIFLKEFLSASTSTPTALVTPLTKTEAVGRQLFSDYVSLASQNRTSSEDLNALANKYAESILRESKEKVVRPDDLAIIADSEKNLREYGNAILLIRAKYRNLVISKYQGSNFNNIDSPEFKNLVKDISTLYQEASEKLLGLNVPETLAENHLALVNNYLSSAQAMRELGNISADPIKSIAALNTQAKNSKEEDRLLVEIQMALMSSGIILGSGI